MNIKESIIGVFKALNQNTIVFVKMEGNDKGLGVFEYVQNAHPSLDVVYHFREVEDMENICMDALEALVVRDKGMDKGYSASFTEDKLIESTLKQFIENLNNGEALSCQQDEGGYWLYSTKICNSVRELFVFNNVGDLIKYSNTDTIESSIYDPNVYYYLTGTSLPLDVKKAIAGPRPILPSQVKRLKVQSIFPTIKTSEVLTPMQMVDTSDARPALVLTKHAKPAKHIVGPKVYPKGTLFKKESDNEVIYLGVVETTLQGSIKLSVADLIKDFKYNMSFKSYEDLAKYINANRLMIINDPKHKWKISSIYTTPVERVFLEYTEDMGFSLLVRGTGVEGELLLIARYSNNDYIAKINVAEDSDETITFANVKDINKIEKRNLGMGRWMAKELLARKYNVPEYSNLVYKIGNQFKISDMMCQVSDDTVTIEMR